MASIKVSSLEAIGSVAAEDLLLIIDESGDSPISNNVTVENLGNFIGENYAPLGGNAISNINMSTHNLSMNTGGGSGGGNLNLDGGYIYLDNSGNSIVTDGSGGINFTAFGEGPAIMNYSFGGLNLNGNRLNMNTGGGTGGQQFNMDEGSIYNATAIYTDGGSAPYATQSWVSSNIGLPAVLSVNAGAGGSPLYMQTGFLSLNNGLGTGGTRLNLDSAGLYMTAYGQTTGSISDDGDGGIHFSDQAGNILWWNVWDAGNGLQLNGANLVMYNATGSGGATLYMDNGSINDCASINGTNTGSFIITAVSSINCSSGAGALELLCDLNMNNETITNVIGVAGPGDTDFNITNLSAINSSSGPVNFLCDLNMGAQNFYMNGGDGSGGGTLDMDNGSITTLNSITFQYIAAEIYAISAGANSSVCMNGNILNMGSGSAGGRGISMDNSSITNCSAIQFTDGTSHSDSITGNENSIQFNANPIFMNDGTGSGGGAIAMDAGAIWLNAVSAGASIVSDGSGGLRLFGSVGSGLVITSTGNMTSFTSSNFQPSDGYTGTGSYTTFTIVNGLITAAS